MEMKQEKENEKKLKIKTFNRTILELKPFNPKIWE